MAASRLRSQRYRARAPEADALRLAIGWTQSDLPGPYVLVESVAGDSHPGSVHLGALAAEVAAGVREAGAAPAQYTCTDMCDGIAQGTDAMDFSLPSRDIVAAAVEMHARSGYYDAVALISGCDKAVPAHLMAAARLNLPAVHVPGGSMPAGRDGATVDQIGAMAAAMRRGELDREQYRAWVRHAAPSCGSCAFMGTALSSQVLAETLGFALPHSAVAPADGERIARSARAAGAILIDRLRGGVTARDLITPASLDNAVVVHAAIGGSTNVLIHLAAIAREAGLVLDLERVHELNERTPYLLDTRPAGRFPANLFWHAGGVPRVIRELCDLVDLDAPCGTGRPWGEEIARRDRNGCFDAASDVLAQSGVEPSQLIRSREDPLDPRGAVAVLRGNLAPDGAIVKRTAVSREAMRIEGAARVFDFQEAALDAITSRAIEPGTVIVIRFEGPRGSGMPEQYYVTSALVADPELATSTALVTDGRFSGASLGPCVGHVSPEAAAGGPLAFVRDGDLVRVDIPGRRLDLLGAAGERSPSAANGHRLLAERRTAGEAPGPTPRPGILGIYMSLASSASAGAAMTNPSRVSAARGAGADSAAENGASRG